MSGPQPVPWIAGLKPATHGAVNTFPPPSSSGYAEAAILDFSANGNVIGPSAAAVRAIGTVDVSLFPDRHCTALRRALAAFHGVPEEWIVPGNGSTEIIWAVARAFLAPGDVALVVEPTYGEYAVACQAAGANVHRLTLMPPTVARGAVCTEGVRPIEDAFRAMHPRIVWVCHPNNPTGFAFPGDHLVDLVHAAPASLVVVDEAYITLTENIASALPLVETGQVLVVRSLTKDAALAGVRLGYGIAATPVASAVAAAIPPWSVSSLAQAAGLAVLGDPGHLARCREAVATSRLHLVDGLRRLGLDPFPSVTNFVLVPVGDGAAVAEACLRRGMAVRDATSFGFSDCIRIGVRSISDQERLIDALRAVLPAVRLP